VIVTLKLQPIYPWAKNVWYALNGRLVSLKTGVEKKYLVLSRIGNPHLPARNLSQSNRRIKKNT
jgi:hypothetical protein